jgi:hypothetical protein
MKRLAATLVCSAACAALAAPVAAAFPSQPRGASPIACVNAPTKGAAGAENANPIALANVAAVVGELCA